MQVCDFSRSFFTFSIDLEKQQAITFSHESAVTLNRVRIPLECRCRIMPADGSPAIDYVLGASCKTERVNVERGMWTEPNADFCPVASEEDFLLIKRWDRTDKGVMLHPPSLGVQPERHVGKAAEAWADHRLDVSPAEGRQLEGADQVVEAVRGNGLLVAQTEFRLGNGDAVWLEYPVKTVNVSERHGYYQVDTGPVLFPDLSIGQDNRIGDFRLAFVAHNGPAWAEFIVNVPTPLAEGISVNHYSKSVGVEANNRMIEVL